MKGGTRGFSSRRAARHRSVWSVGTALIITAILSVSGVGRSVAAAGMPESGVAGGVNRTVPKVAPPSKELSFSAAPTDAEFLRTGLFVEPLAPVSATAAQENRDLGHALLVYRDAIRTTGANDAVEPILAFLAKHPNSAWKPALQLDLGIVYRQTGHFSKALAIWQTGWNESQGLRDPEGRALANGMIARLSQLEAYLGRKELLQPLLDSIHNRPVGGAAAQLITDSHTGLFHMVNNPGESFRCGPLALKRILNYSGDAPSPMSLRVLDEAHSTPNGLSLSAVQGIAAKAGMNYQMAFRTPGASVVMPAVAHWKVGHYAAIVDRVGTHYLVQDTTFGEDIRVSSATLDEEGSGYFLVPAGPLPEGWRSVSAAEGGKVWGRGDTGTDHDPSPPPPPTTCTGGCTTATVEPETVSLVLQDEPVGYTPPVGPAVKFDFDYFQRDVLQPTTFAYTNFGPNWTFSWLGYVTVNSNTQASVYLRGGGSEPFTFSSAGATTALPGPYSQATLTRTLSGSNSTGFTLTFPDGTFQEFNQAVGSNQFFMTAVGDAAGNTVILTYDSQMRIVAITDAIGQVSTLTYGLSGSPLLVTRITDPFGRSASFTYNSSGQLASITDVLGITSSYTYGQGTEPDFVNTLTTPYGSTTFTYGDSSTNANLGDTVFLKTVDPLGRASYVEFDQGVDAGDTTNGSMTNPALIPQNMATCNLYLYYRNTFIFDANEYAQATQGGGLNHALGKVIHWLHTSDYSSASRVKESEKEPLENRVWYNYPTYTGQPTGSCNSIVFGVSSGSTVAPGASSQPTVIGRVLDSGATQLQQFNYNPQGNITVVTDPVGRQITYTYAANNIDRLTTANTTFAAAQLLETRTYNSQHMPLTITGVNGKTARYQYNAAGQMTRYTDPLGHATAYTYDSSGHLKTIQGPITGSLYSFSYDNVGRIAAVTDPAAGTVHYTYDAADRPTTTTYPDGTSSQLTYNLLDLASSTDRLGQTTSYSYDADRELLKITDALGHTLQQGYNLAGHLSSVTDSNGHTTAVMRDAQSRVVAKQYADGTSQSTVYESSISLPAAVTDALGQVITLIYNSDNTRATIGYTGNQATPSVSFAYDPAFLRLTSMTDGVGTTTYSYYPVSSSPVLGADLLQSVSSPIAGASGSDTVTYSYDALNRIVGRTIDGASQSIGFDALGRVTSVSNSLDTFTYSYSDATARVTAISSSQGPAVALSYFGPQGDELLQQLTATTQSGGLLSQFGYTDNSDDNVTSFTQSSPALPATSSTSTYTYDTVNRLQSVFVGAATTPTFAYGYDPASNLTSITANGSQQSPSYTVTNALVSGTYDANGSPTALAGNTYTWDGANRIVGFSGTANNTSSFTYDGLGRVVRIVDTNSGTVVADHSYLWCGPARCLAHDNTQSGSPVSTQYWDQGVITHGTPYYYVEDNQGSVRQLVTTSGNVAAQYDYDPYGNPTTVTGTATSDIGYAGYFYHQASGLEFALFRAYDPAHARWLNRDPIGQAGGVNLYAYAEEDPIGGTDPSGFCVCQGKARVLQGNSNLVGQPGGFDTSPPNPDLYDVTSSSAAVIPSQFGMTKPGMRQYINQISGTLSNGASFNDVRDVVDDKETRDDNGWTVAQFQQYVIDREQANADGQDLLILELPGISKDAGIQDVTLNLPNNFTCPHGTK